MSNEQERLEAVIAANTDRISESVRRGEEQLASDEPLKTLDEIDDELT